MSEVAKSGKKDEVTKSAFTHASPAHSSVRAK